jgi:hypothetical protein
VASKKLQHISLYKSNTVNHEALRRKRKFLKWPWVDRIECAKNWKWIRNGNQCEQILKLTRIRRHWEHCQRKIVKQKFTRKPQRNLDITGISEDWVIVKFQ